MKTFDGRRARRLAPARLSGSATLVHADAAEPLGPGARLVAKYPPGATDADKELLLAAATGIGISDMAGIIIAYTMAARRNHHRVHDGRPTRGAVGLSASRVQGAAAAGLVNQPRRLVPDPSFDSNGSRSINNELKLRRIA